MFLEGLQYSYNFFMRHVSFLLPYFFFYFISIFH